MFICPIDVFDKLNLEFTEEKIYTEYYKYLAKTPEEKKHPSLSNFEKSEKSLKVLKEKLEFPTAELISDGMVSADFVLEFAKILLSKK